MAGKNNARAKELKRKRREARKIKEEQCAIPNYAKRLFKPIVDESKHSKDYKVVTQRGYVPAAQMMEKCFKHFNDKDGNFVEQFQTTGFSPRLWELYLNTFFVSEGFSIDGSMASPDFCLSKADSTIFVEAVTTNKSETGHLANIEIGNSFEEQRKFHIAQMSKTLWSKVQKKYWDKDHVKGLPLIFALECFHDEKSLLWSDSPLIDYLYGKSFSWHRDENNQLVIENSDETSVDIGGKPIPSGLFNLEGTRNISAVIFSNSATVSKFLRMGKQKWPKFPHVVTRMGTSYKHDKNATTPDLFHYEVGNFDSPKESWGSGLTVFHNPNASFPLDPMLFPDLPQGYYRDGNFVMVGIPPFHPMTSITTVRT